MWDCHLRSFCLNGPKVKMLLEDWPQQSILLSIKPLQKSKKMSKCQQANFGD